MGKWGEIRNLKRCPITSLDQPGVSLIIMLKTWEGQGMGLYSQPTFVVNPPYFLCFLPSTKQYEVVWHLVFLFTIFMVYCFHDSRLTDVTIIGHII